VTTKNVIIDIKGEVRPRTDHEGTEGEWRYSSTLSLTSALDGRVWFTLRSCLFIPGKKTVSYCTGGWVGPRASLDGYGKCTLSTSKFTISIRPSHRVKLASVSEYWIQICIKCNSYLQPIRRIMYDHPRVCFSCATVRMKMANNVFELPRRKYSRVLDNEQWDYP
jgi:hypothetical protein